MYSWEGFPVRCADLCWHRDFPQPAQGFLVQHTTVLPSSPLMSWLTQPLPLPLHLRPPSTCGCWLPRSLWHPGGSQASPLAHAGHPPPNAVHLLLPRSQGTTLELSTCGGGLSQVSGSVAQWQGKHRRGEETTGWHPSGGKLSCPQLSWGLPSSVPGRWGRCGCTWLARGRGVCVVGCACYLIICITWERSWVNSLHAENCKVSKYSHEECSLWGFCKLVCR